MVYFQALPGLPRVIPSTPAEFFANIERTDLQNLVTWSGELYLELHNGTYTTHCEVKSMNRITEFLLRDCEFVSAIQWAKNKQKEKYHRSWEREWKNVLLNQFHDVLPGTSIGEVYEDAKRLYDDTLLSCGKYLLNADGQKEGEPKEECLLNSLPWTRVVESCGQMRKVRQFGIG